MRSKSSIYVLASEQQCRPLVADAGLEHPVFIVASNGTFQAFGKPSLFLQGVDVNGVEPVSAIHKTFDLVCLVIVCLCGQIPGIGVWVNDSGRLCPRIVNAVLRAWICVVKLTVTPTVGLISTQPARSAVRNGM